MTYTQDHKARESGILGFSIRADTTALLFHSHMVHYSSPAVAKGGRSIEGGGAVGGQKAKMVLKGQGQGGSLIVGIS